MHVAEGNFDHPQVIELLEAHVSRARAETGRGSAHALDASGLKTPDIRFWTIWEEDRLLGLGALKALTRRHGEIKSMHTAGCARQRGVGSAMLAHISAEAARMGMTRRSLETGSWDYFLPARAFYRRHGFVECAPFGDYKSDPNSVFMMRFLNHSSVEIRPYTETDFEAVTAIWLASWQSTGIDAPVTLAELRERWLKDFAVGRMVYVAMAENDIAGFMVLRPGLLDQLFIAPTRQSEGFGKALLDFAKQQMPEGFELRTALHSRAPAFYEREGLERGEVGIHPRLGHEIVTYYWRT
ncbi:MAG TPA: GNAT family N-acetyltransferase [Rhizomicrobium sp.]|nr:GNAT family N-acetyltransferase [Rhizomicrobium sp.]